MSPFDPAIATVLEQVLDEDNGWNPDPFAHREHGYPISAEQGELLYVLARATGARRVVEFATSIGFSTICLAAAVRDNGGGLVIGSEIVPEKVERARTNLAAAGLSDYADIRPGDALETLHDVGPIDLVLLDGWPTGRRPSIDFRVLEILAPQMRSGALLVDDNCEPDVVEFLRDPGNGFRSVSLPTSGSPTELAVRT